MNTLKLITLQLIVLLILASTFSFAKEITSIKKGKWQNPLVWSDSLVPTALDNVTISLLDTVTIDTTLTDMTTNMECNNLTILGTLRFPQSISINITVHGNIYVQSGAYFRVMTSLIGGNLAHTMTLYGDITNYGIFDMKNGSANSNLGICAISFVGASNSTVTMVGGYTTANNEFGGVTINKEGNAKIILGSDMHLPSGTTGLPTAANPVLTLTRGIIETGPYTLIHLWTNSTAIVGGSDSSFVLGSLGRGMGNTTGATKEFVIGDSSGYRPIKIRSTDGGFATGNYAVVRIYHENANTGASILDTSIDKVSSVRYYKIVYRAITPAAPVMPFDRFQPTYGKYDGVAAGNTNLRVAYSVDGRATWQGLHQGLEHITSLDTLPRYITPDSLLPSYTLDTSAASVMYIALARAAGTTENSLDYTPDAVNGIDEIPSQFSLSQNYPNPFNPSTMIQYNLTKSEYVSLNVYDILGKQVATLVDSKQDAGVHEVRFDASVLKGMTSGIYFYRLKTNSFNETKKMILSK